MHALSFETSPVANKWIVFIGPCCPELAHREHAWGLAVPPIKRGDLPRLIERGYRRFGIIDGEFGQNLSVSITEIRDALAIGASVVGSSSMGALRALEAGPLGMHGVGWVYEQYLSGEVQSDEEVALTFNSDRSYEAVTVPLINLRWAVTQPWAEDALSSTESGEVLRLAGDVDYRERSWARLRQVSAGAPQRVAAFLAWAAAHPELVDRKRLDALQLLASIAESDRALLQRAEVRRPSVMERAPSQPAAAAFVGSPEGTGKLAGTHRMLCAELAEVYAEGLAKAWGVSRVAEISALDPLGVHCFSSIRPFAETGDFTITGGKGYDRRSARLAALAEACERACLSPSGAHSVVASLATMSQTRRVMHPTGLILDRASTWSTSDEIAWWPTRDLSDGQELWVPAAAVFYPFEQGAAWLFNCNTAGTAVGATLTEALLYAVLEVLERDQLAYAELCRRGRRLDLLSVTDQDCRNTLAALAAADTRVHCWVVENDLPFALFYVVLEDTTRADAAGLVGGLGYHLDPAAAFKAALLEAVYSRLTVISGAREDIERDLAKARSTSYEEHRSRALGWEIVGPDVRLETLANYASSDIATDLRCVMKACEQAGLTRILCCELSPHDSPLKVVRAIVPRAEQAFHARTRLGQRAFRWLKAAAIAAE